jgi:hypothetical protein
VRIFGFLEYALVELLYRSLTRDTPLSERVFFFRFGDGSFDRLAIRIGIVESLRDSSLRGYRGRYRSGASAGAQTADNKADSGSPSAA